MFNKALFAFLIVRTVLADLPFNLLFMMLYGPAYLWNFYLGVFLELGWCANADGGWDIQLLCGLLCGITYKFAEVVLFTPWTAYQMWAIEKKYELAEPTIGSFIW